MGSKNEKQPVGSLKISEDVIATIASVATLEIEGVASLEQAVSNKLFPRGIGKKPVQIDISDDFVQIDLHLNLKFGAKIGEVCKNVQQNVKDNVQTMTGMAVSKVNVMVSGITFLEENTAAE